MNALYVLYALCEQGRTAAVEALLQVGADLTAVAARGTTALHAASYYGHLDSVIIMSVLFLVLVLVLFLLSFGDRGDDVGVCGFVAAVDVSMLVYVVLLLLLMLSMLV